MTEPEFKLHFKRLYDKYPNHFKKGQAHIDREYSDWYTNFIKLDSDITEKAFDYYFKHLAKNWFPPLPDMLDCYKKTLFERNSRPNLKPCEEFSEEQNRIFRQQYYENLEKTWPGVTERFARKNGKDESMRGILGDELYDSIPEKPEPKQSQSHKSNINCNSILGKLKTRFVL